MFPRRGRGGGAAQSKQADGMMPVESASVVVRKVPLNVTKEQMEQLFLKAGAIKYVYFPKIPRHFTTKYCFIKFHDIRRAKEAQQLFDGYRMGDQWLQVVAYDPTYKFRHSSSCQNTNTNFEEPSNRTRHSSASTFPTTGRSSRSGVPQPVLVSSSTTAPTVASQPQSSPVSLPTRFVSPKNGLRSTVPSFLNQAPRFFDCEVQVGSNQETTSTQDSSDSEDEGDYAGCRVVDNILMDSEIGFWTWLHQRLAITGPLHYQTNEINGVILKLPVSSRKQFAWPLAAFRLCDKERYQMFGPFLCLLDQATEAKAKCFAMSYNWRTPFREFWEPMAPSEIHSFVQLIQYLRKMLLQFGPQRVDDMKIRQLLQSLTSEYRHAGEKLPTSADFADFLVTPAAKKVFNVLGSIMFLSREHMHILHMPSAEELNLAIGGASGDRAI